MSSSRRLDNICLETPISANQKTRLLKLANTQFSFLPIGSGNPSRLSLYTLKNFLPVWYQYEATGERLHGYDAMSLQHRSILFFTIQLSCENKTKNGDLFTTISRQNVKENDTAYMANLSVRCTLQMSLNNIFYVLCNNA